MAEPKQIPKPPLQPQKKIMVIISGDLDYKFDKSKVEVVRRD